MSRFIPSRTKKPLKNSRSFVIVRICPRSGANFLVEGTAWFKRNTKLPTFIQNSVTNVTVNQHKREKTLLKRGKTINALQTSTFSSADATHKMTLPVHQNLTAPYKLYSPSWRHPFDQSVSYESCSIAIYATTFLILGATAISSPCLAVQTTS